MLQGSLLEYGPVLLKFKHSIPAIQTDEVKVRLPELQQPATPQFPIPLDEHSHFIYRTKPASHAYHKYAQPAKRKSKSTAKKSRVNKTASKMGAEMDFLLNRSMTMFQDYKQPASIAVDNLRKRHYLLRSIVKASEENNEFGGENQFQSSFTRMQRVFQDQAIFKPKRDLPREHIRKKEQFEREFNVMKADDLKILDTFRRPELTSDMVRAAEAFVQPHQEEEVDVFSNRMRSQRADYQLLRKTHVNKWLLRRGTLKGGQTMRAEVTNQRKELLTKLKQVN